jgi:hypothetical protein
MYLVTETGLRYYPVFMAYFSRSEGGSVKVRETL